MRTMCLDKMVIREGDWIGRCLHSKEEGTQGYLLTMIVYGLGILPLIRDLREDHPKVTQSWCADDTGAGHTFAGI